MSRLSANTHGRALPSTRRLSLIPLSLVEADFAFAFDNPAFADRVLCVRLLPDVACGDAPAPPAVDPHLPFCPSGRAAKALTAGDRDHDNEMPDTPTTTVIVEAGDGGYDCYDNDDDDDLYEAEEEEEASAVMRLNVNSMLLAGRSRFFLSLFSAGMIETNQKEVLRGMTELMNE
jgi:hypothetical protein